MGAYTKKNPKRGVQLTEHSSLCLATLTAGCAEAGLFFFPFLYVRSNTETQSLLQGGQEDTSSLSPVLLMATHWGRCIPSSLVNRVFTSFPSNDMTQIITRRRVSMLTPCVTIFISNIHFFSPGNRNNNCYLYWYNQIVV